MSILDLSEQQIEKDNIQPKINKLNQLMVQRKPVWNKATLAQRKKWIQSGKDPIMSLAWTIYKYLRNNFFNEKLVDEGEI